MHRVSSSLIKERARCGNKLFWLHGLPPDLIPVPRGPTTTSPPPPQTPQPYPNLASPPAHAHPSPPPRPLTTLPGRSSHAESSSGTTAPPQTHCATLP